MNPLVYPNSAALLLAGVVQDYLALSVVQLFQAGSVVLGVSTTLTELNDAEADFTGYTPGGNTITAWLDPLLADQGGASIDSGLNDFIMAAPYTTPNTIQGWYLTDAGGELLAAGDFPLNKTIAGAGDGVRFNIELILFAS